MPEISVVLPVRNGERFLGAAIDSVLAQTHRDFELLVIDDGSTDRSAEVARGCADPRVRVLQTTAPGGLSAALNLGLERANGMFIARQDADDLSAPSRFAAQAAYLRAHPEVALLGTLAHAIDERGRRLKPVDRCLDRATIVWYAMVDNPFIHTSVMFRRDPVRACGGFEAAFDPYCQDFALWGRVMRRFAVANLPSRLVTYRVHGSSIIGGLDAPDRAPAYHAAWRQVVRELVQRHVAETLGSDAVTPDESRLLAGYLLGTQADELDAMLAIFVRLLALYAARNPGVRESVDFHRTIARQADAIAFRVNPPGRAATLAVYRRVLGAWPEAAKYVSWPRVAAAVTLGGAARRRLHRLRTLRAPASK